jgi:hypothetical protein
MFERGSLSAVALTTQSTWGGLCSVYVQTLTRRTQLVAPFYALFSENIKRA